MRNAFHVLIGCTIMYTIGILTGFTDFNITFGNVLGVVVSSFIVGTAFGFIWEWYNSVKNQSFFDFTDIGRTAAGSIIGGVGSLLYFNQTLMIVLLILSAFLVIKDLKK